MVEPTQSEQRSPWEQGYSIEVLRQVSAGIVATVQNYSAVPVDAGGVPAEWVLAEGVENDAPVALYFHGGAFLCGTIEQYRNATVGLSRAAQVRVLCVDYRLAPEHPHPAAFEDAQLAYRWVLEQPNVSPAKLLIAGDSAGASLAVGVVMDALEIGLPAPACIIVNSPFVDLALTSQSLDDPSLNQNEPNKATIQWLARTYLEAGQESLRSRTGGSTGVTTGVTPGGTTLSATDPRHSPVYRELSGLPPLLVQIGGLDNLRDDGVRLAARAEQCAVITQCTKYPSSGHIWIVLQTPEMDPQVATAFAEIREFVAAHLR